MDPLASAITGQSIFWVMSEKYKFWNAEGLYFMIETNEFLDQKLFYIHSNPVDAEIVDDSVNYLYSSARDYSGAKGLIDIELLQ